MPVQRRLEDPARIARTWAWIAWIVYAITVPIRAWYIFVWHDPERFIYSDMLTYIQQAVQFFDPTYRQTVVDTVYPPGTGYFFGFLYWAFGLKTWPLTASLFIGSCLIPVLVYVVARRLFSRRTALVALVLASTYFHFLAFAGYYLSETAFTVCVLVAFLLVVMAMQDERPWVTAVCSPLAGLAVGAGTALKSAILLPFLVVGLFLAALLIARKRVARLAAVGLMAAAGLAIVLVPLSIRATRLLDGQFCLVSTNGEMVFYQGHSGQSGHFAWDDPKTGIHHEFGGPSMLQRGYTEYRRNAFAAWDRQKNLEAAWAWITAHPFEAFVECVDHVYAHFTGTIPWPPSHAPEHLAITFTERLYAFIWLLPAGAFILRLVPAWVRRDPAYLADLLVLLPMAGMAAVAFLTLGDPRYRVPFDGFTCILAARFYTTWWSRDVEPGVAILPAVAAAPEPELPPAPAAGPDGEADRG